MTAVRALLPFEGFQCLRPSISANTYRDCSISAKITKADELGEATLKVFGALYKVMGGGFLALGIILAMLTLFGVWNNVIWAKLAILVGALIAGGFSALIPREVEQATGVRTPWRIAAALTALTIVAFVISIL
jgi:hypothetical protein